MTLTNSNYSKMLELSAFEGQVLKSITKMEGYASVLEGFNDQIDELILSADPSSEDEAVILSRKNYLKERIRSIANRLKGLVDE